MSFNFGDKFKTQVIGRFVESYKEGRTPTPVLTAIGILNLKNC